MFQLTINSLLALALAVHLTVIPQGIPAVMPAEPKAFYSDEKQEQKAVLGSSVLSKDEALIWEEVKEETISEKIIRYSVFYQVDPILSLNVACAESCTKSKEGIMFNPNAKNPNSTASGIFQFIEGTWKTMCEGDVFNKDDNIRCGIRILAKEGGIRHWEASRKEGYSGGWENRPYNARDMIN